jgi:glycosyltransferase involved in cell wall biosynthesis
VIDVAIDVGPLHGHRTGVGQAVSGTLQALAPHADVHLVPYLTSARARVAGPTRRLPVPGGVALRWWARRGSPAMDRWLGRPDVVHGTNYPVPPARCPRLVSVYDCWFLEHPEEAAPPVRLAGGALRRAVADGAHVVASSRATARRVRELLDTDRVTTVPLGPPLLAAPPLAVPGGLATLVGVPYVLALGTVERRKDMPTLIAAFARLAANHERVHLVIAGRDGDDAGATDRAMARLSPGVAARVHRTGPISEPSKAWLLHHATVLAYPSLDEGFGFPILEAQVAGVPVVASAVGSIPEVGGPAVLLGPPRDVDALAANLHWVVADPGMRERLATRGRRNVERYSWERTGAALADLYRLLADRSAAVPPDGATADGDGPEPAPTDEAPA